MAPAAAAADGMDRPLVSIGMKVWNAAWFSYLPGPYSAVTPAGVPVRSDAIDAVEGERKTTTFPALSLSYQKFSISASYGQFSTNLYAPHSAVIAPNGMNVQTSRTDHLARKESDLGLAYALNPNVSVSVSYKYATEKRDTSLGLTGGGATPFFDATLRSVLFGAQANFPIQGNLLFYGQMAYGPATVATSFADKSISVPDAKGRYLISEIGLIYRLSVSDAFVKGAYVGLGYRSQTQKTDGVGPSFGDKRSYRDVRDGIILSLSMTI